MQYITTDDKRQLYEGESALEVVTRMADDARQWDSNIGPYHYMTEVSRRCYLHNRARVDTVSPERFLADLTTHGYIEQQ